MILHAKLTVHLSGISVK